MTTVPTIVGLDLGKNWFHLIGLDADGAVVSRKKLNRRQLVEFAATTPACVIAMEACAGSQYWGRVFTQAGHEARSPGHSRSRLPCERGSPRWCCWPIGSLATCSSG